MTKTIKEVIAGCNDGVGDMVEKIAQKIVDDMGKEIDALNKRVSALENDRAGEQKDNG